MLLARKVLPSEAVKLCAVPSKDIACRAILPAVEPVMSDRKAGVLVPPLSFGRRGGTKEETTSQAGTLTTFPPDTSDAVMSEALFHANITDEETTSFVFAWCPDGLMGPAAVTPDFWIALL
jgi:hypothetical protein